MEFVAAAGMGVLRVPLYCSHLVPLLSASAPPHARQGAVHMVDAVVKGLGTAVVPYLLLLVVPVMGRMSDPVAQVRQLATATFAPIVALLPLAQVIWARRPLLFVLLPMHSLSASEVSCLLTHLPTCREWRAVTSCDPWSQHAVLQYILLHKWVTTPD